MKKLKKSELSHINGGSMFFLFKLGCGAYKLASSPSAQQKAQKAKEYGWELIKKAAEVEIIRRYVNAMND